MDVPLKLDRDRTLRFDLKALRDLEQLLGGVPIGIIVQQLRQAGVTAILSALHVGLRHEDPDLTHEQVVRILEAYLDAGKPVMPIARALNEALEKSQMFRAIKIEAVTADEARAFRSAPPTATRRKRRK